MSLADEYGTDVEIYLRTGIVYADSRTDAPEQLLTHLDDLGFDRKTTAIYVWHELPEGLSQGEMKRRSIRAALLLTARGYDTNISRDLYDKATHAAVVAQAKSRTTKATHLPPAPASHTGPRRSR
ncbi:hypothetical protein ABZ502_02600 [Streptomyces abikoensis]|uniref:hypothetical protein n=1 Tax=Streptomyces abikoensis TaxID=97398 RepID=UPI0033DB1475